MTFLAVFLFTVGMFFAVVGVIGLFRFPDVYTRVKALALINFPAAVCIHAATSMLLPGSGERGYVTALLFVLSGPVLSYAILFSACHLHIPGIGQSTRVEDTNENREEE